MTIDRRSLLLGGVAFGGAHLAIVVCVGLLEHGLGMSGVFRGRDLAVAVGVHVLESGLRVASEGRGSRGQDETGGGYDRFKGMVFHKDGGWILPAEASAVIYDPPPTSGCVRRFPLPPTRQCPMDSAVTSCSQTAVARPKGKTFCSSLKAGDGRAAFVGAGGITVAPEGYIPACILPIAEPQALMYFGASKRMTPLLRLNKPTLNPPFP